MQGGYLHATFRNLATSYFLTHAFYGGASSMIASDRNVGYDSFSGGCNRFGTTVSVTLSPLSPNFRWGTNLHNQAGNILRLDGRVEQHSNQSLVESASTIPLSDANAFQAIHIIFPR